MHPAPRPPEPPRPVRAPARACKGRRDRLPPPAHRDSPAERPPPKRRHRPRQPRQQARYVPGTGWVQSGPSMPEPVLCMIEQGGRPPGSGPSSANAAVEIPTVLTISTPATRSFFTLPSPVRHLLLRTAPTDRGRRVRAAYTPATPATQVSFRSGSGPEAAPSGRPSPVHVRGRYWFRTSGLCRVKADRGFAPSALTV